MYIFQMTLIMPLRQSIEQFHCSRYLVRVKANEMGNIFWFRRDLRLEDNAGLYHALRNGEPVQCVFIFDKHILDKLKKDDPRVSFIHRELNRLNSELKEFGSSLRSYYGKPEKIWKEIINDFSLKAVFTNRDYEPYAKKRDEQVQTLLKKSGIQFHTFKDHIIFEKEEVCKDDGLPYTVFTPYKKKWLAKLDTRTKNRKSYFLYPYPTLKYSSAFAKSNFEILNLDEMGFEENSLAIPSKEVKQSIVKKYDQQRNFPAISGTTKLGIHFRFGTISIREKAQKARKLNETYLSELIWRDFYSQILDAFPHVEEGAFRSKYDAVEWRDNEEDFEKWCKGNTGYPMVDAGMRELNATGYMHNRVRMIVASFLTKHLLIHWSWGEAYFAEKLLDFDLASNSGGWQWASGSGTDAAPYFRIFNPTSQMQKFDKNKEYIKKWIPEFGSDAYPEPMVDHKFARERCLNAYKTALNNQS